MPDKYKSVWISHSSINDFLSCDRLYYLKNVFKDPMTRRKINIASPHLSLGIAVHKVIEDLKKIKSEDREKEIKENLLENFKNEWKKYTGKKGGFTAPEEEKGFFERGENMIERVVNTPAHLLNKIIPLNYFYKGDLVPNYYLSTDENLILCGSIDWIEYLESEDKIRIIDFKTGRNDEDDDSFQLPIYYLLISNLMKENSKKIYEIKEAAYWYLDHDNKKDGSEHDEFHVVAIDEEKIKEIQETEKKILEIGIKIKNLREKGEYKCKNETVEGEGCRYCRDFEKVFKFVQNRKNNMSENTISLDLDGEEINHVEYLGISDYNQDMYFVK